MANRSNFGDLLEPGFREIFDDKYNEVPSTFERIFNVHTSDKQDERDSAVSGFGYWQETGEGQPLDYEDPVQMYDKVYVHLKYTKGFKITRELWEDDQYNVMNKKPAALGRAARRTVEYQAAQVFNRAFNTSYLGGDGKPLVSTTHPRADGGSSQSNASSTGIPLNENNLETAIMAMRKQTDDKGMKIDVRPDTLIVPVELSKTAHLIVDSNMRSGTADNDVNPYKGQFKIIDWLYLDNSTTQWFLIDSNLNELHFFWRVRPEFKQDEAFDTDLAVFKGRMRFSDGWSDWRGIWGSKGDSAAYSS